MQAENNAFNGELQSYQHTLAGYKQLIRINLTSHEKSDELHAWVAECRSLVDKVVRVALRILHSGGHLYTKDKTGNIIKSNATESDVYNWAKGQNNELAFYEQKAGSVAGPSIRIPPGGLTAHESEVDDRHVLRLHVLEKATQLSQRLDRSPRLAAVSSFLNREIAEDAIGKALAANETEIRLWLSSTSSKPKKIDFDMKPMNIGLVLRRGASAAVSSSKVFVLLTRDSRSPVGYWIKTAYVKQ